MRIEGPFRFVIFVLNDASKSMLARLRLLPVHQLLRLPSLPRKIFLLVKFRVKSLYAELLGARRHILIQGRLEYGRREA